MATSPISTTVDFEKNGKQHGYLKLPYSHDASAWGSIMLPITVLKGGSGPTALLTGGNHGDEYEGPIALWNLANTLEIQDITGRVIIVPAMNYPAFKNARRTSPIDKGNLNRSFPGNPKGSVTEKIADYFQNTLLPLADYVLDFHSGGKTLDFLPFCASHILDDKNQQKLCQNAMLAFNAPYSVLLREIDQVGMFDTASENMGKIFISTELGGGGSATPKTIQIAKRGIQNFLSHAGITKNSLRPMPSTLLEMPDNQCFISSEQAGLLELCIPLGKEVKRGEPIAKIHDITRTGIEPYTYQSAIDGIFIGRHFPGLIEVGDVIAVLAKPV